MLFRSVCAMDNQGREAVSLANVFLIGKFFVRENLNGNRDPESTFISTFRDFNSYKSQ